MKNNLLSKSIILTAFVVFAVAATVFALRGRYTGTRVGKADANYIKSTDCRVCHEEHYSSWYQTHHRQMTQEAAAGQVQGDFERDNTFEYLGVKAKMEKRPSGFFMDFAFPDGNAESYKIERTVGSRRIEQYVARQNGQYYRLPIAFDLVNNRWISLNGSFFYPDGNNFKQHMAQWDTNCVFCHNVKAQPNLNLDTRLARTEVAELGIACGACHAQGAEHAEQAASPLTRLLWHLNGKADKKIVDPLKIDTDRSMMICGHCHGQRVPEPLGRIAEIMTKGDPYDAGRNLNEYYRPIHQDTKIGTVSFSNRFWTDGSPRLTAYEYQGITGSACFLKGVPGNRINCSSCHTMHEGDVKGQITEEKRSNTACTQCHSDLAEKLPLSRHTGHDADSPASSCYACHMPEVVYGIQAIHKTHMIAVPDPRLTVEKEVPNACNQCHVDKSANWAIEKASQMWPGRFSGAQTSADPQFDIAEGVRGLFAGDALTRALMADAMMKHADPNWSSPFLTEAFDTDPYPIVRYFAANSLARSSPGQPKPDYLADHDLRSRQISIWQETLGQDRMAGARRFGLLLRQKRNDVDLEVGE